MNHVRGETGCDGDDFQVSTLKGSDRAVSLAERLVKDKAHLGKKYEVKSSKSVFCEPDWVNNFLIAC